MTRVLIVDDQQIFRSLLRLILSKDPTIEIVGEAENGREAVQKVQELKPDLVTMDIEMPIMNGLEAIEQIMSTVALPILVISSNSDSQTAYEAISKGALELLPKMDVQIRNAGEFNAKIKSLAKVKVITHIKAVQKAEKTLSFADPVGGGQQKTEIIAIAASTGGPHALSVILSKLPKGFSIPIVIAQHISLGFAGGFADWLQGLSRVTVKLGIDGEEILAGTVYISPPEKNMVVNSLFRISLLDKRRDEIYHPSCNALLTSVAEVFGPKSVGLILTGMGNDGVVGLREIQKARGMTIAQNEASSVIFGMPKLAIDGGFAGKVLALEEIAPWLLQLALAQDTSK